MDLLLGFTLLCYVSGYIITWPPLVFAMHMQCQQQMGTGLANRIYMKLRVQDNIGPN
jgi:hypothetical protein